MNSIGLKTAEYFCRFILQQIHIQCSDQPTHHRSSTPPPPATSNKSLAGQY
jgi:hypothetical protein